MTIEINKNLYKSTRFRYPWLKNIPKEWVNMVNFLGGYKPIIFSKVIYQSCTKERTFKCNVDEATKGNHGPSAGGFCIRNWKGKFIFVASYEIGVKSSLDAKVWALEKGLSFCISHNFLPVTLESDSLIVCKILAGV